MTRVQWTEEENLKVAQAFFDLSSRNELPSRAEEGWRKAQEIALPNQPIRWRPFTSSAAATGMNALLRDLLQSGKVKHKAERVIQPPAPEKKILTINGQVVAKETYDLCVKHHVSITPPPKTLDDYFRGMISEQINAAIPSIVKEALESQNETISQTIKGSLTEFMKYLDPNFKDSTPPKLISTEALAPPPSHKPTIVLVNANAPQVASVQSAFPQFDIRAVQDRVPGESSPLLVVGFTKFMSRATDDGCNKKFSDAYLRLNSKGAASEARRAIGYRLRHLIE